MRRPGPGLSLSLASMLLFTPALSAQDSAQEPLTDQLQALTQEFDEANAAWNKEYQAASKEERQALFAKRPKPAEYAGRFWKIVDAAPEEGTALRAATWLMTRGQIKGTELERALGIVKEHHADSPLLDTVCRSLARTTSPAALQFLHHVETNNPHDAVKGMACFSQAEALKGQVGFARTLTDANEETIESYVGYFGREAVDILRAADPDELEKKAEALYQKVLDTPAYASLKHYGGDLAAAATSNLFELRNLAIGKTAPNIIGEDIDGNPMKLSDYRGKVVVLDFWGDW